MLRRKGDWKLHGNFGLENKMLCFVFICLKKQKYSPYSLSFLALFPLHNQGLKTACLMP